MTAKQKVYLMIKSAKQRRRASEMQKSARLMTPSERLQLLAYKMLPDALIPEDFKGSLIVNSYLDSAKEDAKNGVPSGNFNPTFFERSILKTPGTNLSIYNYLNGRGKDKVPELVAHKLGKHWYTGPAKLLSRTSFGRDAVIDKVLDKTLPKINGSNDISKQFLMAGGMV